MQPILPLLLLAVGACSHDFKDPSREFAEPVPTQAVKHQVIIHQPTGLGVADVVLKDSHGVPIGVRCATCHGPEPSLSWVSRDDAPEDFHGNVDLVHGNGALVCDSCHDQDRTKLHLASGTKLDVQDAMTLCAQCHGVQFRDYTRGSHGGMTGHWDLNRGGRERNHCLDCHAAHAPAYQQVMPVHPPRDRYLEVTPSEHDSHDAPKGEEH